MQEYTVCMQDILLLQTHLQRSASATASASACVGSGAGTMPCDVGREAGRLEGWCYAV